MKTVTNDLELKPAFSPLTKPKTFANHIKEVIEKDRFFITGQELLHRKVDKIPCLVDPILPKSGVCGLAGSSDTGKSSLLRQLAISVCSGDEEFLGFRLEGQYNKAIYVSTEDDEYAVSFLLNKSQSIDKEKADGLIFIFETETLLTKLQKILSVQPVDLIIIDAFSDLYGRSMNETNQVRTFLNDYSQLARKHRCLIMFLHHTGKRTEELAPSKHNLLGSQGFEAKMRLVIELRNDPIDPSLRHLCVVKGNYLPQEYKDQSYEIEFRDDLTFEVTGRRKPFDELTPTNKSEIIERVRQLHGEGKTQEEIASMLGISQSTVCRHLKKP